MSTLWGIDLGGTKIELAVIDSIQPTKKFFRERITTEQEQGYEHIVGRIRELVSKAVQSGLQLPRRIGISHPGTLDPQLQTIKNSNTVALNGKALKADLETSLGLEVVMANDANCFALAEATWGAGSAHRVVFGVILGTGVGGGIVIDKQVIAGRQGISGEWGHNVLDPDGAECYCGKRGCVETIISGPAVERAYRQFTGEHLSLSDITSATHRSNDNAVAAIAQLTENFGRAIATVINLLDPDCIVLGGGVSNVPELYTDGVSAARRFVFNNRLETSIVKNQLGDSAGVLGAAFSAKADD